MNVVGSINVFEAAKKQNNKFVIYTSSGGFLVEMILKHLFLKRIMGLLNWLLRELQGRCFWKTIYPVLG